MYLLSTGFSLTGIHKFTNASRNTQNTELTIKKTPFLFLFFYVTLLNLRTLLNWIMRESEIQRVRDEARVMTLFTVVVRFTNVLSAYRVAQNTEHTDLWRTSADLTVKLIYRLKKPNKDENSQKK